MKRVDVEIKHCREATRTKTRRSKVHKLKPFVNKNARAAYKLFQKAS